MAVLIPHSLYGLSTRYSIHMYDSVALVHTFVAYLRHPGLAPGNKDDAGCVYPPDRVQHGPLRGTITCFRCVQLCAIACGVCSIDGGICTLDCCYSITILYGLLNPSPHLGISGASIMSVNSVFRYMTRLNSWRGVACSLQSPRCFLHPGQVSSSPPWDTLCQLLHLMLSTRLMICAGQSYRKKRCLYEHTLVSRVEEKIWSPSSTPYIEPVPVYSRITKTGFNLDVKCSHCS